MNLICNYNKVDITPDKPVYLAGFANRSEKSDAIHKPIFSQCLVMKTEKESICLISNDYTEMSQKNICTVKNEINRLTGFKCENIMIHSIHTHSAPIMSDMLMKTGDMSNNENYSSLAIKKIINNSVKTISNADEYKVCKIKIGEGKSALGICRRSINEETGQIVIGKNSLVESEQKLLVLELIEDESKNIFVTIINYACHPVCLHETNLAVSSDYVGAARELIDRELMTNTIFLNGAAGDINPDFPMGNDLTIAEKAGCLLGESVLKLDFISFDSDMIKLLTKNIKLPFEAGNIDEEYIDNVTIKKIAMKTDFYFWADDVKKWGDIFKEKLKDNSVQKYRECQISAFRFGKIIFFFSQGEIFSKYQSDLRKKFNKYKIFFVGYTDGETGYLPEEKAFDFGGYEVEQAFIYLLEPSPLSKEATHIFKKEAETLIENLLIA